MVGDDHSQSPVRLNNIDSVDFDIIEAHLLLASLFGVARVIEEDRQFDAAVTELRPARIRAITGV